MTEDKRYFIGTEEGNQVDITIWDLQDRTTWDLVVPSWQTNSGATVHNLFIQGNYAHITYYYDGYIVLDISNPELPFLAGEFDTSPVNQGTFTGAFGVYPYLPSGVTIVSDIEKGLYVFQFTNIPSGVEDGNSPFSYSLKQNYPNPFNPSTTIDYQIPQLSFVTLKVYDVLGNEIAILVNAEKSAGSYEVEFNGSELTSGIYFYRLQTGNFIKTIKMMLMT